MPKWLSFCLFKFHIKVDPSILQNTNDMLLSFQSAYQTLSYSFISPLFLSYSFISLLLKKWRQKSIVCVPFEFLSSMCLPFSLSSLCLLLDLSSLFISHKILPSLPPFLLPVWAEFSCNVLLSVVLWTFKPCLNLAASSLSPFIIESATPVLSMFAKFSHYQRPHSVLTLSYCSISITSSAHEHAMHKWTCYESLQVVTWCHPVILL